MRRPCAELDLPPVSPPPASRRRGPGERHWNGSESECLAKLNIHSCKSQRRRGVVWPKFAEYFFEPEFIRTIKRVLGFYIDSYSRIVASIKSVRSQTSGERGGPLD